MKENEYINYLTSNIYTLISQRIKNKKKELKLTNEDISANDTPLVSRILNNRRLPTKNPYLLTPNLTDIITIKLKFGSNYEVIWGNPDEHFELLPYFFSQGFKYLLENDTYKNKVNNALFFNLDYVSSKVNYDIAISLITNSLVKKTDEHAIIGLYEYYQNEAIYDFIKKYKKELYALHKKFFYSKYTTKLDQNIELFFKSILYKFVYRHQSLQGHEFYNLLLQLNSFQDDAFFEEGKRMENYITDHANEISTLPQERQDLINLGEISDPQYIQKDKAYNNAYKEIIQAGKKYIETITKNQKYLNLD